LMAAYEISHLPVGHNYQPYAEPLGNTVCSSLVSPASLCRNPTTDALVGLPSKPA